MNKAFEKILERLNEECISPIDYPGYVIDLEKVNEIVQEVAEEYKKETYFNLDNVTLHKCPKCGGNAQHRVNGRGSWACGCFECKLFKSNYDHQKAIQEWEDYCKEYNNGWIPCSERLPDEEEIKKAYCRNMYGSEFIVMIEGATLPTTLYRTLDGFWVDERREIYKVIAWQPLPAQYNDAKQQED